MANPIIEKHTSESKAFQDKDPRVLITSGASFTPYFLNGEKLCMDTNISKFLKVNEDNATAIIEHSIKLAEENSSFKEDIEIMSEKVDELLQKGGTEALAVSGGMRRDLIFSGPIAKKLDIPHISLYKQTIGQDPSKDKVEIYWPNGKTKILGQGDTLAFYDVHVSDLLTKGSSQYDKDIETGREIGWIPMLRERGATINDVVVAISRLQGGEARLALLDPPINVHSFVETNEEFLKAYSENPEAALAYSRDEVEETKKYLLEKGVEVILPYLEPGNKNLDRAKKFMAQYDEFLKESGLIKGLEDAVEEKYKIPLQEIIK